MTRINTIATFEPPRWTVARDLRAPAGMASRYHTVTLEVGGELRQHQVHSHPLGGGRSMFVVLGGSGAMGAGEGWYEAAYPVIIGTGGLVETIDPCPAWAIDVAQAVRGYLG